MAEQIPFWLALPVILGIIVILDLALLAVFYAVSTRTPDRYLRAIAPAAVLLLGISSQMNYNAGSVFAGSALVAAPVAAFIAPVLFPGFAGPEPGIRRMVACCLIVSLIAAGFAFYIILSGFPGVPWIFSHAPVSNAVVYIAGAAVDLVLAAGIYAGMERAGVPKESRIT